MIYNLNSKALDELGAYIKLDKIDGEKNGQNKEYIKKYNLGDVK